MQDNHRYPSTVPKLLSKLKRNRIIILKLSKVWERKWERISNINWDTTRQNTRKLRSKYLKYNIEKVEADRPCDQQVLLRLQGMQAAQDEQFYRNCSYFQLPEVRNGLESQQWCLIRAGTQSNRKKEFIELYRVHKRRTKQRRIVTSDREQRSMADSVKDGSVGLFLSFCRIPFPLLR